MTADAIDWRDAPGPVGAARAARGLHQDVGGTPCCWTLGPIDGSVVRLVSSDGQLAGPLRSIGPGPGAVLTYTAAVRLPCVDRALVAWRDRSWAVRVALLDPTAGP